jgi:hypothetical protein
MAKQHSAEQEDHGIDLAPMLDFARGVRLAYRRAAVLFTVRLVLSWAVVTVLGPFHASAGSRRFGAYTVVASVASRRATVRVEEHRGVARSLRAELLRDAGTVERAERAVAVLSRRLGLPLLARRRVLLFLLKELD